MARQFRPTAAAMLQELKAVSQPGKAAFYPNFFRAFPGGYGEGDRFLGVVVPDQRVVARKFREMDRAELERGLQSPWHEMRLTSLFVLVGHYAAAKKSGDPEPWVRFYLDRTSAVNNWDLVDSSAGQILGDWLVSRPAQRKILHRLSRSGNLWEQRISVVATMPLVKAGDFADLLEVSERLLTHPHDLIHKAVGWLLREMGKQDLEPLLGFLDQHAGRMPRTMLRYSLEKLAPAKRQQYMNA